MRLFTWTQEPREVRDCGIDAAQIAQDTLFVGGLLTVES